MWNTWQKGAQYIMQKRAENLTMINGKISISGQAWKQKGAQYIMQKGAENLTKVNGKISISGRA